jgi:hypothetical protein
MSKRHDISGLTKASVADQPICMMVFGIPQVVCHFACQLVASENVAFV